MTEGQIDGAEVEALLAQSRTHLTAAFAEMNQYGAELAAEAVVVRAEREAVEAERDAKARAGELGEDARRIQERVDLNQTSWALVSSGLDTSPEAAAARTQLEEQVEWVGGELDAAFEEEREEGEPDPREELLELFAELQASVAELMGEGETRGQ